MTTPGDEPTTVAAQLRGLAADLGAGGPLTLDLGEGSARLHPSDPVRLELERDGRRRQLEVTLAPVTDHAGPTPTASDTTGGDGEPAGGES
ncbi:amphi-Trp domain-containing protein [Halobaculum sp. MBLA0143]|uniref:amphi-Trp domain-containing protein n=1 Tax=Halobaculum sp. MBLA0143 TaxID=3079933 RepID=UPI003523FA4E